MKRTLLILTALCACCLVSCKKADLDGIKSITLDVSKSTLKTGESLQLTADIFPGTASDKPIKWTSSNPAVASVSKEGLVKAIARGSAEITVKAKKGDASAVCKVWVMNHCPADAVDMGIDVYWAKCNLGATSQEQPGGFYAWDETSPKTSFPKRSITDAEVMKRITDDLIIKPEYDAATVALGGTWRLPTQLDYNLLWNNCTKSVKTINGQKGVLLHSNTTNNELFFPLCGHMNGDFLTYKDEMAFLRVGEVSYTDALPYWGELSVQIQIRNINLIDLKNYWSKIADYGYQGMNIRPICD